MIPKTLRRLPIALAAALLGAACASSGPALQRLGPDELFQRGMAEFQEENWTQAISAFQRLALEYPTHPNIQEARFRMGEAYMARKEYLTATAELLRLVTDYPTGEWADDSRFRVCESYAALSPKIPLDQEYTRAAIDHCSALAAYYPDSEFAGPATELATRMRNKLAEKVLYSGNFYFDRGAFDSALVYFEEVVEAYPETAAAPRALFRMVRTYERLGYEDEREEARRALLERYPDSAEARELRDGTVANGA